MFPGSLGLSTLLAHTSVGIAASDIDGRLTLLSPALENLFKQPFAPWPETDRPEQFDLWSEDGSKRLQPVELPLARARAGEVVKDAFISTRTTGTCTYLRCNAAPLHDASGSIQGAIALLQDVTSERRALLQQGDLHHRLVRTVNHEFRTPLAILLGHVELLQDSSEGASADILRSLSAVATSGERLRVLVQTVSELMDLEVDAHASREQSDINELVRQIADDFGPTARERDMSIHVDCRDPGSTLIDVFRIRKALAALVQNALAHGPSGSAVSIHTCGDDTWAQVSVTDVGPGIPARDRDRLVRPFERGDTTDDSVSSRGLGLAVANTVVTAHGGRLLFADHEPRGLVATMLIPRRGTTLAMASDEPPHEIGEPCPFPRGHPSTS